MSNRQPDYDVFATHKTFDTKGKIGAAWKNDNGTISIVLNEFTNLQQDGKLLITLLPRIENKSKPKMPRVFSQQAAVAYINREGKAREDDEENEPPF